MMNSLLGDRDKGLLFVVSAPAGTGKTTLVKKLCDEFPSITANISFTTRQPRVGEIEGVHYHFISEHDFKIKIDEGHFLEHVSLYGTYYGSSLEWIKNQQAEGKHVVLVIDTQGALQLKNVTPAIFIFIRPPSLEVLRERLIDRRSESPETLSKRLQWAQKELECADFYDYQMINDDLNHAYQIFRSIFIAECHRSKGFSF